MERAMGGRIERGLVELVTNSDDSYCNLEDEGKRTSGKIRIEIERRKTGQPSTVIVLDKAEGMNRLEMYQT
jgi:translation initiation factor 1 (eIF-1/SUI1)